MHPSDLSDDQLLEVLTSALAPEPPEHHVDMLMTGYDLYHADDLVAAMTHDSDAEAARGVRAGATAVRELTFTFGDVVVDVEVAAGTLVGQVLGATVAEIVLETPARRRSAPVDDHGRFRFGDVPGGTFRLALEAEGGRVVTAWSVI